MGGPSSNSSDSSGGGGTYSEQLKTIQKKKKVVDFIKDGGVTGAIIKTVKKGFEKSKTKKEANVEMGLATDSIKNYTTATDNDNDGSSASSIVQPKVKSQMDNKDVKSTLITATGPTDIEMATTTELSEDEKLLKRKRGKKTRTILSSVTGDNSKATLSNKTLLG